MSDNQMSFLVGRLVSWLEAVITAIEVKEETAASIKEIIAQLRTGGGNEFFLFGQVVSWAESLGAALPAEDKARLNKLLAEVDSYVKGNDSPF